VEAAKLRPVVSTVNGIVIVFPGQKGAAVTFPVEIDCALRLPTREIKPSKINITFWER
jgi:hypothetical protein